MTEHAEEVTREEARAIAQGFLGEDTGLHDLSDEQSTMPSYRFGDEDICIAVTKQGGYVSYLIDSREVGEGTIAIEDAVRTAADFLVERGIENMKESYYETKNGVVIINFAAMQGDVILYPDLVKVGVALDDGGIVSFDARGYLVSHQERELPIELISEEEAAEKVKDTLTIEEVRLAMIPTAGKYERLCYEFHCSAEGAQAGGEVQDVLVYINAETGYEEQVLLLIYSEDGVLTV